MSESISQINQIEGISTQTYTHNNEQIKVYMFNVKNSIMYDAFYALNEQQ